MKIFAILTGLLIFAGDVGAQPLPSNLPPASPAQRASNVAMEKSLQNFMSACRTEYSRRLKIQKVDVARVDRQTREICICLGVELKRQNFLEQIDFLTKVYRAPTVDEQKITETQAMILSSFDNLETNCQKRPSYRYGQSEPRLPYNPRRNLGMPK